MIDDYSELPKVVQVIDGFRVAINRGTANGVSLGDRYLIFRIGKDVIDPDTGENLGPLEIVVGKARVSHLQEKLCTLRSDEVKYIPAKRRIIRRSDPYNLFRGTEKEEVDERPEQIEEPLDAKIGDLARPI